mgnify:CR=1 FL=1
MNKLSYSQFDHAPERFRQEMEEEAYERQRDEMVEKPKSYYGEQQIKEQKMSKLEAYKAAERSVNKTLHGEDVYAAINRTANAIGFVGKAQTNNYQNYNFRGIDDVYNVVGPALMKSDLVVLPTLLEHTVTNVQTSGNKATFQHFATVKYTCVSTKDCTRTEVVVKGESVDNSDKGLNKAMSAAYKLFAFQTFCIPLEGSSGDTESESIEILDPKRVYFNLLVKKYKGKENIPQGVRDTAKSMTSDDYTMAINNLEKSK